MGVLRPKKRPKDLKKHSSGHSEAGAQNCPKSTPWGTFRPGAPEHSCKWRPGSQPWYLVSHIHICAVPHFCNTSRDNCAIPRGPKDQIKSRFRARLKISSENENFERATHRGPIFCGEFETSRLKFASEIKKFDRD